MRPPLKTHSSDDFQTPYIAMMPLLKYIPNKSIIWDCAAGKGNIVSFFSNYGYLAFGTDILESEQYDFIHYTPRHRYDIIVTNPPYSLKQQFLERVYSLNKPFAFLLPLTALETHKRQQLYKKYGLQLILFDKRINFETPSGKSSSAWFATAWFTWGLNLPNQLNFIELENLDPLI